MSNDDNIEKKEPVEEIIIPLEKGVENQTNWTKIIKMEHYKISKLSNNSTVSKLVAKNRSK